MCVALYFCQHQRVPCSKTVALFIKSCVVSIVFLHMFLLVLCWENCLLRNLCFTGTLTSWHEASAEKLMGDKTEHRPQTPKFVKKPFVLGTREYKLIKIYPLIHSLGFFVLRQMFISSKFWSKAYFYLKTFGRATRGSICYLDGQCPRAPLSFVPGSYVLVNVK